MRFSNFSRLPCIFLIITSRKKPVQMLELKLWNFLSKTVSRGQRKSRKTQNDDMLIKNYRTTRWTEKKTAKEISKHEPMCIHFNETCLKRHTKKYYRPDERLDYFIITLADGTLNNLSDKEKDFLAGLGVKC